MPELDQHAILAFLASPESSGGLPVKRIDTHAASVFLSGSRALKVKREVKFPFLDYSTLERRRRACMAEIEANRRFAPGLYEGLARITKEPDGSLRVGGEGEVVEWAVQMRRFDETLTLDRYAERNEITPAIVEGIVRRLAAVHAESPKQDVEAWIAALRKYLREHHDVFRKHPDLFAPDDADRLLRLSEQQLAKNSALIETRAKAGLLVRGHGDLHLGNVTLLKGEAVIFDAVEFDPLIASGDVLYDLAFLLMDLWVHGQQAATNAALNGYLEASAGRAGLEGLALLPLFLSMRSSIRAIVAVARYDQDREEKAGKAARKFFNAAREFIAPTAPRLLAIGGLSGTGKSVIARSLAPFVLPIPGAVVVRSDVKRKALAGVGSSVRLPASSYTRTNSRKVYDAICADAALVLAAGHSAILDAVFSAEEERAAAMKVASDANVQFQGIQLHTDVSERLRRVAGRVGDASDADREVVLAQEAFHADETMWARVDSSSDSQATLAAVRRKLSDFLRQKESGTESEKP